MVVVVVKVEVMGGVVRVVMVKVKLTGEVSGGSGGEGEGGGWKEWW